MNWSATGGGDAVGSAASKVDSAVKLACEAVVAVGASDDVVCGETHSGKCDVGGNDGSCGSAGVVYCSAGSVAVSVGSGIKEECVCYAGVA